MVPTRPVLRYHGGKFRLSSWIISHFPKHRIYVEPFGGAGSVLFRKPRSYAEVYNDLDGEIVNLFRVLRDPTQARELERLLRMTPYARSEFDAAHLTASDPIEQARRTIIRSFMGFGSDSLFGTYATGFRGDTRRNHGIPAHDWAGYPEAVSAFTDRLRGVVIENRPAAQVILQHDGPDTLHYCDPPYPQETRACGGTKHGYRHEMTNEEHRALGKVLKDAKGMVVISSYPCALYDEELFPEWRRVEKRTTADGAHPRTEVLWLNPAATKGMQGRLEFEERGD